MICYQGMVQLLAKQWPRDVGFLQHICLSCPFHHELWEQDPFCSCRLSAGHHWDYGGCVTRASFSQNISRWPLPPHGASSPFLSAQEVPSCDHWRSLCPMPFLCPGPRQLAVSHSQRREQITSWSSLQDPLIPVIGSECFTVCAILKIASVCLALEQTFSLYTLSSHSLEAV